MAAKDVTALRNVDRSRLKYEVKDPSEDGSIVQETNVLRGYNRLVDPSSCVQPHQQHNERPLTQTHLFPTKTPFILRQEALRSRDT